MNKKMALAQIDALAPLIARVRSDITWVKIANKRILCKRNEPLTKERLLIHFMGGDARGVCPMNPGDVTYSAVLDLDSHGGDVAWQEMEEIAFRVFNHFRKNGLKPTVWRSSGGKGAHLYFLWKEPQDARSVRHYMAKLLADIGYSNGTGGVSEKQIEIFPKQDSVPEDGCGNQFILPGSALSVPLDPLDGMQPLPITEALNLEWPVSEPVPVLPSEPLKKRLPPAASTVVEIETLLAFIDPDEEYDTWLRVGMAISHATNNSAYGFELFHRWNRGEFRDEAQLPQKYKGEAEARAKWKSFARQHDRPVTIDTLRRLAMQNGWKQCTADEEFGVKSITRITVQGGGLANEVTQAEAALIDAGVLIFERSGSLVRPVCETVAASDGLKTKLTHFLAIDTHYMMDLLCREIQWRKLNSNGKPKAINASPTTARTLLSRQGDWKFPRVVGVISTPTIRPDGSILLYEGYDAKTRLYGADFPTMPNVPMHPTREECLLALEQLDELLDEFPFINPASRSAALSALITPVVRASFPVAPLHAATAPTPGTGKSYIFDIAAAIILGQRCPVMAAGKTDEETEKRLGALLLTGQPIISLDNVNGELGGDALCQAVERPLVEIRILGKSERARIEARSTLFANGNNIRLLDDLTRRAVICGLDSKAERPELRRFKRNPVQLVLDDRGTYVAAALTIVRGYIAAGRPYAATPLASFEGWSNNVRSALIWLGLSDPVSTMELARQNDPIRESATAVLSGMRSCFGFKERKTAAEILHAVGRITSDEEFSDDQSYSQLREALKAITDKGGLPTPRELGRWMSQHKGRVFAGMRLRSKGDAHGHVAKWWIEKIAVDAVTAV